MGSFRTALSIFLLTSVLVCSATVADAEDQGLWFEQVFNTGSYNMGITQDRDGFLWLTTTGGLIRYDGYQQKIFTEGPNGLTSNFVPSVFEDSEGLIWIVTLSGLDLYNKNDGTITHLRPEKNDRIDAGSSTFNWAPHLVTEDRDGRIWIGSKDGVLRYDKKLKSFAIFRNDPKDPGSLGNNDIWTVMADTADRVWIGTSEGLDVFDRNSKSFTHFRHDRNKETSIGKGIVYAVTQDKDGTIWIGTSEGGLNRFQEDSSTFVRYTHHPDAPGSIADDEVFSITADSHRNLWLGRSFSKNVGLERFDEKTGTFTLFTHKQNVPGTLSGNIVLTCFEDRAGILWVPDNTGPINKNDPFSHRFKRYATDPDLPETRGLSGLTSVYQDSRGDIWLGGQKGLSRLDHRTEKWQWYPIDPRNPQALWNTYVFSVIEDSQHDFWVATDDGNLNLFDRDKGIVIKRFQNPFVHNTARQIIEDRTNPDLFWFGVEGYGIFNFNKKTGKYSWIRKGETDKNTLSNDYVYTLAQDRDGIIWVQTQGGLYRYEPQTGRFTRYMHDPEDPGSISGNVVNDIFIDRKGRFWVSTDRGLNRFDPASGRFTRFGLQNGFSTMILRTIVQDDQGMLWLGSNAGLFEFDPDSEQVVGHYTELDGLQSDSFSLYGGSAIKARDGRLWFVGLNGANSFDPKKIRHNTNPPPVYLLSLTQGGQELVSPLKTGKVKQISLGWRHNYFEFEYVGLNLSQSLKNQYRYKLEGWDNDWYNAGNKRFGRYSGLSGGDYVLKILAANNDGVWSTTPATLAIHVDKPFWVTWWFYTLIVFVLVGMFRIFFLVRVQQLKKFNKELEKAYIEVGKAEKKYRSIFENAIEGIFQLTPDCRVIDANPAAAAIMGFDGIERMRNEIANVWDWAVISRKKWHDLITRLQRQGAVFGYEIQAKRKNGEIIWLALNLNLLCDESGAIQYVDGIMEDITTRKDAENQLRLHQEHLERLVEERTRELLAINSNLEREIIKREKIEEELLRTRKLESIGVLAGGIAHDFNNLMTIIMGNINLAQLKPEMKDSPELEAAVQALRRAKELTQKFMTFSSGGDPIKTITDIEELTRSAVDLSLSGSAVETSFSVAPGLWKVYADQRYISQAMFNVIENGKQAMEHGGHLDIRLGNFRKNETSGPDDLPIVEGDYVSIEFLDNGCGIPAEHLPKIFDPYFTTADMGAQKGKGLGLTIAYSIIKKHQGYTFVDSTVGKGTRVRILLPAVSGHPKDDSESTATAAPIQGTRSILIMDDEEMLRIMTSQMLGQLGFDAVTAADGDTAIKLYKASLTEQKPFAAVILDLTIPGGIGGQEVVKILGQLNPDLIAIVSSGYADDPVVADFRQYGFTDVLSKPYGMTELREMLARVLPGS